MYSKLYNNIAKVMPLVSGIVLIFILCLLTPLAFCGCKPNYDYCDLDTSAYSADSPTNEPHEVNMVEINKQVIDEPPEYITVQQNIVYINPDEIYNFEVQELTGYTLCFLSPAIVTIEGAIRCQGCAIYGTELTLVLNANIYCGGEQTTIETSAGATTCEGSIVASNLVLSGNGTINCQNASAIEANNVNIASGNIVISSKDDAIKATNLNIYGGAISIAAQNGIFAQNINFYGADFTLNATDIAINCDFLHILNGIVSINKCKTAIICNTITKPSGFLQITGKNGINCNTIGVGGGLLYANCTNSCIKATHDINISGGTNLLASSEQNSAAIDADVPFTSSGGLTVQNSPYACHPTMGNYYGFKAQAGEMFCLKCKNNQVVYMVRETGSLCISGNFTATSYTTRGKLNGYKNCFYGLLIEPSVNNYGSTSIRGSECNLGASWCNIATNHDGTGQLF